MIETAHGNLLNANAQALVNTVNTEGVMGKGIALQFKNAYPQVFKEYAAACKGGQVRLGQMDVHDLGSIGGGPRWVINFPTKGHWRSGSRLADVASGLRDLVATVQRLGIESIAIPPLGCGNGGLDWDKVRPLIEQAFAALPAVQVLMFEPVGAPAAATMPNHTAVPKLTTASASLVLLMHRYLQGLMDPFVTLLEVNKLMYFMQEAGQPLKLKYQAHHYGPYAPNLGHVLKRLDGHFLLGYGAGSSDPTTPLEPTPEGVELAYAFLARDDETNKRFDRVTKLIDGYEDAYGMEMLSTMHWVMVHNPDARKECEVAIQKVHAWSPRKRQLLKPAHLEKAWLRLKEHEWDFSAYSISNSH
ncbi:MAG: type II toxin-antitoxin system antitoxin DNA ADP-ribosyl glycohydrolase DarG [Rhodoferax sp.]